MLDESDATIDDLATRLRQSEAEKEENYQVAAQAMRVRDGWAERARAAEAEVADLRVSLRQSEEEREALRDTVERMRIDAHEVNRG